MNYLYFLCQSPQGATLHRINAPHSPLFPLSAIELASNELTSFETTKEKADPYNNNDDILNQSSSALKRLWHQETFVNNNNDSLAAAHCLSSFLAKPAATAPGRTYKHTHQVPLLLEQRVREEVVSIRIPVLDTRIWGNISQQGYPLIWIRSTRTEAKCCVITLFANLLMLLLHPLDLGIERIENAKSLFNSSFFLG